MNEADKLSEQAPVRLSPEVNARLEDACRKTGEKRPQFIRRAIQAELDRVDALRPTLDAASALRLEKIRALAALHVDVDAELERLLETAGQPVETVAQG